MSADTAIGLCLAGVHCRDRRQRSLSLVIQHLCRRFLTFLARHQATARRTREFNVATRERPEDLQLWLDFAAFQDDTMHGRAFAALSSATVPKINAIIVMNTFMSDGMLSLNIALFPIPVRRLHH